MVTVQYSWVRSPFLYFEGVLFYIRVPIHVHAEKKKPLEEWRGFLRRASAAFAVVVPASTCTASAAPTAAPTAAVGACARRLQGVRQFGTQQGQLGGEPVAFTHAQHGGRTRMRFVSG